jgi:Domain of unknown function (DUF4382)
MNTWTRSAALVLVGLSAGSLIGCGGSGSDGTGTLTLGVTDAPIDDATSVVVQFSGVAFKREGAAPEVVQSLVPTPRQIDLLEFQDGRAALLLDGVTLPAGRYEWLRLIVDDAPGVRDSYLVTSTGAECELEVPSGAESGLKLNRGFSLPADGSIALTVDFNLNESLRAPPGQQGSGLDCTQAVLMRPTLRVVDNANVGAIAGLVDATLVTPGCMPKVYVFSGAGIVPDDIEDTTAGTDVDPLTVAAVHVVSGATQFEYHAAFLPAGSYTAAFTCSDDDPTNDDALVFSAPQNAVVQSNLITTVNFAPPPPP